jgi:nucleotide-binding universal stress UspA family protein
MHAEMRRHMPQERWFMGTKQRKRILVAVDGSENALQAVRYVAKTLPAEECEVVLFHVLTRVPESFWDLQREPAYQYRIADVKEWEAQQERVLHEFLAASTELLYAAGLPREAVTVRVQDRAAGIARDIIEASQQGFDMVVVGRRGLSELKDFVMGSIANKLVEKLVHVPIGVVGSEKQGGKMLIALDASEGALAAVDCVAGMMGREARLQVMLFHVVRGLSVLQQMVGKSAAEDFHAGWLDRLHGEFEEAARTIEPIFIEARRRLEEAGVDPKRIREKIQKGSASRAEAIVDEAEHGGYDTIVVGRRGLSKVQEFFMGRVSNKVIQLARDRTVWVVS